MFDLNMLGKLNEMTQKMEEVKTRLDTIQVRGEIDGKVVVTVTGNRKVVDITIHENLLGVSEKEQLQDMVVIATNRALENAEKVAESEMKEATAGLLPNVPGLF